MPRPSWLHLVNSVLFIAACLFVGGLALSGFAHWDPCAWIGGLVFTGPAFALAYWQFAATFRRRPLAAKRLFIGCVLLAGLLALSLGTAIFEAISEGIPPGIEFIVGLWPIALLMTWFTVTAVQSLRWRKRLIHASLADSATPPTWISERSIASQVLRRIPSLSLRELFAVVAAVAVVCAGIVSGVHSVPPQRVMHASPKEARLTLPNGATDVCVARGSRGVITYEFVVDEPGFWEWANSRVGSLESQAEHIPIRPISEPFSIWSCKEDAHHSISRGWYYAWQKEDRAIQYGYDADDKRAYYHAHFH